MEFGDEEYVGEIQPRMAVAAVRVLESALPSILSGNPRLTPQDESKASYFRKRTPEDGRIDFTKTAREVFNLIRGVSKPFPGAFFDRDGKRTVIWRAKIGEDTADAAPGTIAGGQQQKIACSDKFIIIEESETSDLGNEP